jgi:hypothetical protein
MLNNRSSSCLIVSLQMLLQLVDKFLGFVPFGYPICYNMSLIICMVTLGQ